MKLYSKNLRKNTLNKNFPLKNRIRVQKQKNPQKSAKLNR